MRKDLLKIRLFDISQGFLLKTIVSFMLILTFLIFYNDMIRNRSYLKTMSSTLIVKF